MRSLTEPGVQDFFVGEIWVLYQRWPFVQHGDRIQMMERIINQTLRMAGIPEASVNAENHMMDASEAHADGEFWNITLNARLFNVNIFDPRKIGSWIQSMAILYHEMRHLEQFWLVMLAVLSNSIACGSTSGNNAFIETPSEHDPAAMHMRYFHNSVSEPKIQLLKNWFAPKVVHQALGDTVQFLMDPTLGQKVIPVAHPVFEALFGRASRQVEHDSAHRERNRSDKSTKSRSEWNQRWSDYHFMKYAENFVEADAFRVERAMQLKLIERLAPGIYLPPPEGADQTQPDLDEVLTDIGRLFNELEHSDIHHHV